MGVALPDSLVEYLQGAPAIGAAEQVLPLFSVDGSGFPHACLLGRAELQAAPTQLRAAVASAGTRENLERRGSALLLVTVGDTVHHLKLRVLRTAEVLGVLAVCFEIVSHKEDSLGIPLEPMTFLATPEIATMEH